VQHPPLFDVAQSADAESGEICRRALVEPGASAKELNTLAQSATYGVRPVVF
jgi:hypothetical protein